MTVGLIIAGIALALFTEFTFRWSKRKQLKRSGGGN